MMSYKAITRESYQATAEAFARKVADMAPLQSIEKLIRLLPQQPKILDIGSGSGRDAKIFTKRGVKVVGIDFCPSLIAIAKTNAPLAEFCVMDIEEMAFPPGSFDGAWAAASLSHLPKNALPAVFKKIHTLLKDEGHLYLSVKQGSGECLEKDRRYEGEIEKFWSYFEEEELLQLLQEAKFKVLEFSIVEKRDAYQTHPYFRIFCKKV